MKEPIYADIQYLGQFDGPAEHHVYPRSTGRATRRPPSEAVRMPLTDARDAMDSYTLDEHGFAFLSHHSDYAHRGIEYFYNNIDEVKSVYYGECAELLMNHTGASHVIAFDHNLRSLQRADSGYTNMNEPVRFCHNDYTHESGPQRLVALLNENSAEPMSHRYEFINVWRPLIEPVLDKPLVLCAANRIAADDLIRTRINHYKQEDLDNPAHIGEIYSVRHSDKHEWVYLSDMNIDEVILVKCYDSIEDGRARFTPHTAIDLPSLTADTPARESIEVRLVAFFD
ncbi:MAG: CmcJ/NvfI family oxidoreductase [Gammaproteobacteria bacterium]